uniref:Uncharacterized protein n=1 Tax=Anguilla anguilla TaxID=7936 RepID=A0A0E9VWW7_ANGAN
MAQLASPHLITNSTWLGLVGLDQDWLDLTVFWPGLAGLG